MDLTDGGTIAWIVGALFAIVVAVFAIWVGHALRERRGDRLR